MTDVDALIARGEQVLKVAPEAVASWRWHDLLAETIAALREQRDLLELREGEIGSLALHIEQLQGQLRDQIARAVPREPTQAMVDAGVQT